MTTTKMTITKTLTVGDVERREKCILHVFFETSNGEVSINACKLNSMNCKLMKLRSISVVYVYYTQCMYFIQYKKFLCIYLLKFTIHFVQRRSSVFAGICVCVQCTLFSYNFGVEKVAG